MQRADRHLILISDMRAFFLCILFVIECLARPDSQFQQDVGFCSIYQGVTQNEPGQPPLALTFWEILPFGQIDKFSVTSIPLCAVVVSEGKFYAAPRKSPAPDQSLLESPLSTWRQIGEFDGARAVLARGVDGALLVLTDDNVFRGQLTSKCDSLQVDQDKLLTEPNLWGPTLAGLSVSEKLDSLFVCSHEGGLFSVSLSGGGAAVAIDQLAGQCTAALFVDAHATLYASNARALYTFAYSGEGPPSVSHEWIGGVIDTTPVHLVYDAHNDYVWLAEQEAVHRLSPSSGAWMRFGYQQNAPMRNISTVAVVGGAVWVGSVDAGLARISGTANPTQLDGHLIALDGQEEGRVRDPWVWAFYGGSRWLPSNKVVTVVASGSGAESDQSALVVTTAGLAYIQLTPWTLETKAAAERAMQSPRHDRHGLVAGCNLASYGDLTTYYQYCDDNDGLWTSMHAMGMAYWSMSEGGQNAEARGRVRQALSGLEKLNILPGAYPRFPARSFCHVGDKTALSPRSKDLSACGNNLDDPVWHPAPINNNTDNLGYFWKGGTSSDELCGHMAVYPLIYDALAASRDDQDRALKLYLGILDGILDNDYYLIDPSTNKPTSWGFWNPSAVNDDPEHYSERYPNSLQILAWLCQAHSLTGQDRYREAFWMLVNDHGYAKNAMHVRVDSTTDENHSDTELVFLAYHALFYSLRRLSPRDARYAAVKEMTDLLLPSLQRTWELTRGELNPLWLGVFAMSGLAVTDQDRASAEFSLRRWAVDNIDWQIDGSKRIDLIAQPFRMRLGTAGLMKQIRPPSERVATHANNDPFVLVTGGGGTEFEPAVYLLPYYIMRFYDLLTLE